MPIHKSNEEILRVILSESEDELRKCEQRDHIKLTNPKATLVACIDMEDRYSWGCLSDFHERGSVEWLAHQNEIQDRKTHAKREA